MASHVVSDWSTAVCSNKAVTQSTFNSLACEKAPQTVPWTAIHSKLHETEHAGELINLAAIEDTAEEFSPTEASTALPSVPESAAQHPVHNSCMHTYMIGERGRMLAHDIAALPGDVILDQQLPKLLEGLDPEEPVATVQPTQGAAWLPDVSFSHVGHSYRFNAWEVWLIIRAPVLAHSCIAAYTPYGSMQAQQRCE